MLLQPLSSGNYQAWRVGCYQLPAPMLPSGIQKLPCAIWSHQCGEESMKSRGFTETIPAGSKHHHTPLLSMQTHLPGSYHLPQCGESILGLDKLSDLPAVFNKNNFGF